MPIIYPSQVYSFDCIILIGMEAQLPVSEIWQRYTVDMEKKLFETSSTIVAKGKRKTDGLPIVVKYVLVDHKTKAAELSK